MGTIYHRTIVVTGYNLESTTEAHTMATEYLGHLVSPIVKSQTNGYASFFIAPDGSKQGWDTQEKADAGRTAFIAWLEKNRPRLYLDWIAVLYGADWQSNMMPAKIESESKRGEDE